MRDVTTKCGICITHGATQTRKRCIYKGCNNNIGKKVRSLYYTWKRDNKKKQCSFFGCTNQEQNGGVCVTHGAKVKQCSFAGCTNGAMRDVPTMPRREEFVLDKMCCHKGCTNHVKRVGGVCFTHKVCSHEGCTHQAMKAGVCVAHGAR